MDKQEVLSILQEGPKIYKGFSQFKRAEIHMTYGVKEEKRKVRAKNIQMHRLKKMKKLIAWEYKDNEAE